MRSLVPGFCCTGSSVLGQLQAPVVEWRGAAGCSDLAAWWCSSPGAGVPLLKLQQVPS